VFRTRNIAAGITIGMIFMKRTIGVKRKLLQNRKRVLLFFVICFLVSVLWRPVMKYQNHVKWKWDRRLLMQKYGAEKNSFVNTESVCFIPKLNPFSEEVLGLMEHHKEQCTLKKYGRIVDGVYMLEASLPFLYVYVQYIRRAPKKGEITDDFAVTFSEKIPVEKKDGIYVLFSLIFKL